VSANSGSTSRTRGTERLLWDCATIGRSLELNRSSARARVHTQLGEELTALVMASLRETAPSTPHEEMLRRAVDDAA
jgi:hypothetical protein